MLEFTYVMIKPDIMNKAKEERNRIIGDIIDTINGRGLDIVSMKKDKLTKEIAEEHYIHLKDRDFYTELTDFMTSGEVLEMIVFGEDAIGSIRTIIGPTNVTKAKEEAPNSIRAKYGNPNFGPANAIHASDSKENAIIEIERFFNIKVNQPEYVNVKRLNKINNM